MGGAFPGDAFGDVLFENPGFGNHWIAIQLVGVRTNRSAIGARIRLDIVDAGQPRSICRWVDSGGSFGAGPYRQQVGLGKAEKIDRIEIFWPTTGHTRTFSDVAVDEVVRIVEDENKIERVDSEAFLIPLIGPTCALIQSGSCRTAARSRSPAASEVP